MQDETFGVGENIILEGDEGDKIYFITSGRVAVIH
jgi:CRP-like cAMP-binding protein